MEVFSPQDLNLIHFLKAEWLEGSQYYFADYNDNKLHVWMYGAENEYYSAEVGDSCGWLEGSGIGRTLKDAIQTACKHFESKTFGKRKTDVEILEALESIGKLQEDLKTWN